MHSAVMGEVERPLSTVTFDIKQEEFFKLLGVYLHSNPTKLGQAN